MEDVIYGDGCCGTGPKLALRDRDKERTTMRERGIPDHLGNIWTFVIKHPKGGEAVLLIQPPDDRFIVRTFPPRFEAAAVRDFLNDATEPS